MKILIIANRTDDHSRVVAAALKKKRIIPIRWATDEFLFNQKSRLFINQNGKVSAKINALKLKINLEEIDVVWFRRPNYPRISKKVSIQDKKFVEDENKISMRSLWFILEKTATWVNPFTSVHKANTKLCQLLEAAKAGMNIPETLITNDRKEVIDFILQNNKTSTIYKTFLPACWTEKNSRFNCQTTVITAAMLPKSSVIQLTPGIYQKLLPKAFEVRATFFGEQCVAVKIHNTAEVDWRLSSLSANFKITPTKLPTTLKRQCILLMKQLGIIFGCFDFIVTPAGEYLFLEVNEMGQFLWIEEILPQLKLLDIFCDFLISCSSTNKSKKTSSVKVELEKISDSNSYLNRLKKDLAQKRIIDKHLEQL